MDFYDALLGICVSTCYPERVYDNIFSSTTLDELAKIKDFFIFLINFQRFDDSTIDVVCKKLEKRSIKYRLMRGEYEIKKPNIPIVKIRHDCAMLANCRYYFILDDDMILHDQGKYSAAFEILAGIDYMSENPKCGIISYRSKAARDPFMQPTEAGIIRPLPLVARYNTANGLLIRNLNEQGRIFPLDAINNFGGGEEKILAGHQLSNGNYGACIQRVSSKNSRCKHGLPMGWDNREMMLANNDGYIKRMWNDDFDGFHSYNIIDEKLYLSKGGIELTDENIEKMTKDYAEYWTKNLFGICK